MPYASFVHLRTHSAYSLSEGAIRPDKIAAMAKADAMPAAAPAGPALEYDLPEGWEGDVYSWLSDNRPGSVENRDDQGGYPEEGDLRAAFDALGYGRGED